MSDSSFGRLQQKREDRRSGLTGRGITGCISLIVSGALAYFAYLWLSNQHNLRKVFDVPKDWPDWAIMAIGILICFVAIQATFTIMLAVFWRLAGKDKKVGDKMDDLLAQWDDL